MKKIIGIFSLFLLIFLVACGNSDEKTAGSTESSTEENEKTVATSTESSEEENNEEAATSEESTESKKNEKKEDVTLTKEQTKARAELVKNESFLGISEMEENWAVSLYGIELMMPIEEALEKIGEPDFSNFGKIYSFRLPADPILEKIYSTTLILETGIFEDAPNLIGRMSLKFELDYEEIDGFNDWPRFSVPEDFLAYKVGTNYFRTFEPLVFTTDIPSFDLVMFHNPTELSQVTKITNSLAGYQIEAEVWSYQSVISFNQGKGLHYEELDPLRSTVTPNDLLPKYYERLDEFFEEKQQEAEQNKSN